MNPVLVVDDDASTRDMLCMLLHTSGIPVASAANGAEALDAVRRCHPCVILLDLMMPVMDGQQFRCAQLHDAAIADVPVVLLTATHDANRWAERLAVDSYFSKPVDLDGLLQTVERYRDS